MLARICLQKFSTSLWNFVGSQNFCIRSQHVPWEKHCILSQKFCYPKKLPKCLHLLTLFFFFLHMHSKVLHLPKKFCFYIATRNIHSQSLWILSTTFVLRETLRLQSSQNLCKSLKGCIYVTLFKWPNSNVLLPCGTDWIWFMNM